MNPLPDKVRKELNQRLQQLSDVKQQITLAKKAMVPGMDECQARCDQCIQEVQALKQTYFPNKP